MQGDGDGWVTCAQGHRHWGRYGAAGLLIRAADAVVLQHRAPWSHHGDTWGLLGGARDSHETVGTAALREAAEEAGIGPDSVRLTGVHTADHGRWSYTTVLAEAVGPLRPASVNPESVEVRWQPVDAVDRLPLHPGFAATWPMLRAAYPPPHLVVDAANVVGSRPDGWWHRRLSAAQALHDQLAVFARAGLGPWSSPLREGVERLSSGIAPESWPVANRIVGLSWIYPRVTMVVEGQARHIAAGSTVEVVRAVGSGDDAIVDVVRAHPDSLVVTADQKLRRRVGGLGADVVGPQWLRARLDVSSTQPTERPRQ